MKYSPNPSELNTGDKLPTYKTTVTRTDFVKYAGAGGDFNPLHHDEVLAKSVGLPSVFSMGLLQGGILSKVLTDWAGPSAIKKYKIRFMSPVWPNDELTFGAIVKRKTGEKNISKLGFELYVENQKGDRVIEGEADLELTFVEK
jgi:acyl dehydratase